MKRFLALVASVAMVAGAWTLRQQWDGGAGLPVGPREPLTVVCVTELEAACDALEREGVEVTVEDASVTAEAVAQAVEAPADAWLTLQPWPEIVAERRRRGGLEPVGEQPMVVAWSPLAMAVWQERAAVLEQRCRDGLRWQCVGHFADRSWADLGGDARWGRLKAGYPDPLTTASGLLVLGHAAADFVGRTDLTTRDFDSDEFRDWLGSLARGVPSNAQRETAPVQQMLVIGPAFLDVAGAVEAEAGPLMARSEQRRGSLTLHYPEPVAVAEVALAPWREDRSDRLREVLQEVGWSALATAGWRVESQPLAGGLDPGVTRPDDTGLPSAGALDALRERYGELIR